jgi:hypothetical protein
MEHTTQVKHDNTVIGFMLGAAVIFCLFTFVILLGIF